jgi:hypothetical protein
MWLGCFGGAAWLGCRPGAPAIVVDIARSAARGWRMDLN